MEAKIVLSERKVTTIQEQSGIRFEPRDLTATHPDDYPIQEYDVIAITSDGKVRHSEGTFETLDAAKAACQEFAQGETGLDQWTDVPRNEQPSESQDEEGTPKNVLGQIAVKPFYIWANDDCSNKADSFKEAKAIRLTLFNEGGESVHIVDADGVEVVDAEIEAHEALVNAGYFAGARKPEVKPEFHGAFMVNDPQDPEGFAIVGDDIASLILEARDRLIEPASEREMSNPITGLPPIDSNVTVRLIEGMIVTGVVTGHGKKDGKPTFDFEYDHRTPEGQTLKASKWAWPEQAQLRNPRKFARLCLANCGWKINLAGVIPRKSIMTAAGEKEAYAYFTDDGLNEYLSARHVSKGLDILESISVHIPAGSSDDCIRYLIERFVRDAEKTVSEYYASQTSKE